MTKTIKTIPKLRFPEFRDAPEWEEVRLGELSEVRDGTHDSPKFYSSGKPLVTSKNLLTNGLIDITNVGYILEEDYEQINKRSRVDIGDILFGMIGTIGNPVLVQFDGFAIKNVALIKQKDDLLNKYLVHFLNSQYIFAKFNTLHTGNTQKFIALGQIRNLTLPIPKLPEQQKIADCLSSVDELITAQSAKVEALKAHKKALMQQLFPTEGETTPRLRFPEFKNAPAWEEKSLGSIIDYENGKAHENDILENGKYIVVNSKFISTQGETIKYTNSAFCLADKNDILMVLSDVPNGRAIAKCYFVEADNLYTVNQRICKLTTKIAISKFVFYIIDRNKYFLAFDDGVKQTNFRKEDVLNCPIMIPSSTKEQQKIADSLSSIDETYRFTEHQSRSAYYSPKE